MVPSQIVFSSSDAGTDKCFDVKVIDDDAVEGTENFMLKFDTDAKVTLTPRVLNVEIADNDEDINI